MKLVKTLLFFLTLVGFGNLSAQDIHWTMYDMSPLTLNPANTGAYEGTFRIGGIYRDQFNSFVNGFRTPSLYVDAPIIRGFRKNDWVGVGGMLFSDKAGTGELGNTTAMLSVAYHLAMDKKGKTVLTFGLQGGMVQRKLDEMKLSFEDEIINGTPGESEDLAKIDADSRYLDFNAGVLLSSKLSKKADMQLGLAFKHLTTPSYGLISAGTNQADLPLRITAHGTVNTDLTDRWVLSPSFLFNTISSSNEIMLQLMAGYHFSKEKDITLRFGSGYRFGDAVPILLGMDYKQFRVGVAYDINISDLTQISNNQGGFEIALSYIAKIFKTPTIKPVIFCPRF